MDAVGGTAGGWFTTAIAAGVVLGIAGWRFAFHVVALLSVLAGGLVPGLMSAEKPEAHQVAKSGREGVRSSRSFVFV